MSRNARAVLEELLPNYPDESMFDYMCSMCDEGDDDADLEDGLIGFLEEYAGDEDKAREIVQKIRNKIFQSDGEAAAAAVEEEFVDAVKLSAPVIMAKAAKIAEDEVRAQDELINGPTVVNSNTSLKSNVDMSKLDDNEDAMAARVKQAKKSAKKEKKTLKRERTAAPVRNALIESLTREPVVIHGMMGEDGSYGGNPCVDIHMRDFTIDLAGIPILEDANLTLVYGRHYGLIGRNGVGKTTFLKHLSAKVLEGIPWYLQILHIEQEIPGSETTALQTVLETDVEREKLLREKDKIEQEPEDAADDTTTVLSPALSGTVDSGDRLRMIYERLEEIDADTAESRAAQILAGLSFTPEMMSQPTRDLSGGWRMRVALARALFIHPDVLLLDEPTNHLDLHAVFWLENYLKTFENTLIVVSHAREFLNEVCSDILLMQDLKVKRYKGNFESYEQQRSDEIQRYEREKEASDKKRAHVQAFVNKNIGGGAKGASMAKSRQKMLEKMKVMDGIANDPSVHFRIPHGGTVSGGWGIRLVDVAFHYPEFPELFKHVEFSINQNSRICLVGPNGIGKSTLLKVIYEELEPTEGMVVRNQRLRVGRFSQHHVDGMSMKKSPLEQFREDHPDTPDPVIRQHLANMGVIAELQVRPIYTLSGGQKSRVALAMITFQEPHLLLLDEPTNHLDLDTVQALIKALAEFEGGVLVVSHDEHLITAVCDELWIIKDRRVHLSKGDFQEYKKEVQI